MDFVFGTDKIEIDAENPYYTAEQGCILSKDKKRLFHVFEVEKDGTFTVPKGVTKVEYSAFFNDDIKHIILSDEVEDLSFMRMYGVQSLTLGEKYYNGGDVSWLITSFDEHEEIMDLSALNVSEKNPYYSSVDGILYNKEKTKILLCPPAAKKCVMPDTVNSVDKYAFSCNSLREISISDSLKDLTEITERLENSLLKKIHIGKSVEKLSRIYTGKMTTITVSSENQKYKAVKNILYTKDGSKLIWCPEGKTGTVTIPEGTSIIGKGAFENDDKIKKIIILEAAFKRKNCVDSLLLYEEVKDKRMEKQPLNYPNSGSIFKNGNNFKAYEVIRKLNLVGYRIGKSTFSSLHANFIINLGKAKAKDIYVLIRLAKKMALVYENIHLEEEVILYNFRHFNF